MKYDIFDLYSLFLENQINHFLERPLSEILIGYSMDEYDYVSTKFEIAFLSYVSMAGLIISVINILILLYFIKDTLRQAKLLYNNLNEKNNVEIQLINLTLILAMLLSSIHFPVITNYLGSLLFISHLAFGFYMLYLNRKFHLKEQGLQSKNDLSTPPFKMTQNKTPLVSIVIPAYNHASYLSQAIDGVLNQNYKNVELIVLDDGSTDRTAQVLAGYGDQFHWESQNNMGQSATLNKGWAMAQGEILAYLSADDLLYPDAVSRSVECLLKRDGAVLSYCDFDLIDPNSRIVRKVVAPDFNYHDMVGKFICAPSAGAFFWRQAFMKTGGWDPTLKRFPDYDCWLRLGLFGEFVHINSCLAAFRVHDDSQSFAATTTECGDEAVKIIEGYYKNPALPKDIIGIKNIAMASAHLLIAQLDLRSGRYFRAMRQIFIAASLSISTLFSFRTLRMLFNGLFNRIFHRILWALRQRND
jgi:glycosyltransferase involved in cell wall biosynthesis